MRRVLTLEALKEVVVEANSPDEAIEAAKDDLICESDWDEIGVVDDTVFCVDTHEWICMINEK